MLIICTKINCARWKCGRVLLKIEYRIMALQQQLNDLFVSQMREWPLAAKNFADLRQVLVKTVDFDGFAVLVQCNPARMVSSGAKVDAKTIAARPCFLCAANR